MGSQSSLMNLTLLMCRLAKGVAASRFGPKKKVQKDMVGSFVAKGLTQAQTESEIAAQVYVEQKISTLRSAGVQTRVLQNGH